MALPFGKTIKTRHCTVLKFSKSLSKKEVASLREDIPAEIKKHLQRGSLPFIKISDIAGTWGVEFSVVTSMYAALDKFVPVAVGDHYELSKDDGNIIEAFALLMYTDTSLPGDEEYTAGKLKLRDEYIAREAARRNAAADKGKTEEQLRKESDEAAQEVIDRDKHAETLLDMAEQIKNEEPDKWDKGFLDRKTLWHDSSDKPLPTDGVEAAWILALKDDGFSIEQLVINTVDEEWDKVVEEHNIYKWAYQSDLFSNKAKEGGQHE